MFAGLLHPRCAAHGSVERSLRGRTLPQQALSVLVPALGTCWVLWELRALSREKGASQDAQKWVLGCSGAARSDVRREKLGPLAVIPLALLLVLTPELFIFSSALSLTVIT